MEGATRLSPLAGVPSVAAVTSATTPAVAAAGEAIASTTKFEDAPGSFTVMVAFPGAEIRELDTDAARSVLSPNCVGSEWPFQATTDDSVNPIPFTRRVNDPWPAMAYVPSKELLPG